VTLQCHNGVHSCAWQHVKTRTHSLVFSFSLSLVVLLYAIAPRPFFLLIRGDSEPGCTATERFSAKFPRAHCVSRPWYWSDNTKASASRWLPWAGRAQDNGNYPQIKSLAYQSRSGSNPNTKDNSSFVPKIWKLVRNMTFCDISKCHNVTLWKFVTFLEFCHTVCNFFSFLANSKCRKNVEISRMSQFASSTGLFSDVPQISSFRNYVSLSFGSDKSRILIPATFTFWVWNLARNDSQSRWDPDFRT